MIGTLICGGKEPCPSAGGLRAMVNWTRFLRLAVVNWTFRGHDGLKQETRFSTARLISVAGFNFRGGCLQRDYRIQRIPMFVTKLFI